MINIIQFKDVFLTAIRSKTIRDSYRHKTPPVVKLQFLPDTHRVDVYGMIYDKETNELIIKGYPE